MQWEPFRICPFCQAASPDTESRCRRCQKSLAGLALPVYGRSAGAENAVPPASVARGRDRVPHDPSRTVAKVALAATAAGVVVLGAWLAFQDRSSPVRAEGDAPTVGAGALAASEASAGASAVAAPPTDQRAPATQTLSATPAPFPQATPDEALSGQASAGSGPGPRLREAQAREARAVRQVAALRARQESPDIETARQYERLLDEIKAAYAELDRARAEVRRLRAE